MASFTTQVTVDLTAAQTQWQAVKQQVASLRSDVEAVQAAFPTVTVTGIAGPSGTVTYTVSAGQVLAALTVVHQHAVDLLAAVEALQAGMANLPITTAVS
jgi:hypothetical protein